ncbi:hypothetical protein ACN27E_16380 [Mycobacterium sp. WMMD1722]|uniref:hypothetical protein n=1 Tax=Mycobacterium sp. WMMD1722 TaxID=3404117 RepID=UPI003BF506DD
MKTLTRVFSGLAASAATAAVVTVAGLATAQAQTDYSNLPVHPNDSTDSAAWVEGSPTLNPGNQTGVETTFTHRDGTRSITDRVQVFDNPQAAQAAAANNDTGEPVANPFTRNVPVGEGGTLTTGSTPDGTSSVGVLKFTTGNALTTVKFQGPPGDTVPEDVAVQYGQSQHAANQQLMAGS